MNKWIVKCAITGQVMPESNSQECDRMDINWARIYGNRRGAASAAANIQSTYDYWYEGDMKYAPHTPSDNKRDFRVVPVKVTITPIEE